MIFSRIFAPSHTSPKSEKRLEAIKNLSPEKQQEKTILHELAFNDESADVSLAALEKLNSFVLWLKMAQIAKASNVKKAAQQRVNDAIAGKGSLALSREEKATFLSETASPDLIIEVVQQDVANQDFALLSEPSLAHTLLEKVDKPSFTQFVFLNCNNPLLQQQLINAQSQISLLQKWAKKAGDDKLLADLNARIDAIREAEQKPVELKKQLTLCLSKYRALLDKTDVEQIVDLQSVYESELTGLFANVEILNADDREEYQEKHSKIAEQVSRYLDRIRPAWEEKQQQSLLANTQALCEQQLTHAKQQVNWLYNTRLCEATLADVATVNESVRGVEATIEHLNQLDNSNKRMKEVQLAVDELNAKLEAFSLQQQYGQKLLSRLHTVEDIAQKLTDDALEEVERRDIRSAFDTAVEEYTELSKELIMQPQVILQRFKAATKQVRAEQKALKSKHLDELRQVRKQISIVDNLVSQGKFRAAMSKFKKLSEEVQGLPADIKRDIEKRYQKTADDIARLEGWQSYIAEPRKPALVEEAQTLAATPAENIKQRSEAIKYLRSQWLSLSAPALSDSQNSTGEQTEELQKAFDTALEKAFEPCREHYAKLDAERAAALELRRSIIVKAKDIDPDTPPSELSKILDRLAKQWRACGQVEKQDYEQLKQEWKAVNSPLQKTVREWQSQNQALKQALVDKVDALQSAEDMEAAAQSAQTLQQEWKQIGHAGKREESRLWAEFKKRNDEVFERIKSQRKAQNNAFAQRAEALVAILASISVEADEDTYSSALKPVEDGLAELTGANRTKVERKISELNRKRENYLRENLNERKTARAQALISLLQNNEPGEREAHLEILGKRWSSIYTNASNSDTSRHDRQWLTVALEVACEMPSPEADSSTRSSVQLQMMTAKLESGEAPSPADILGDWLSHGEVKSSEHGLLQRVISVIDNKPGVLA